MFRRLLEKHPGFWLLTRELALYRDLWRWVRRQACAPDGATIIRSTDGKLAFPSAMTAATAVEVAAVELLLSGSWRFVLLILSLYSLILLWAFISRDFVYPHYVSHDGLTLRQRGRVICQILAEDICSVSLVRTFESEARRIADSRLTLGGGNGTNVRVVLSSAVDAEHDRWPWQRRQLERVTEVDLHCDRPDELLAYFAS